MRSGQALLGTILIALPTLPAAAADPIQVSPTGQIVYLDPQTGEIRVDDLPDPTAPSESALEQPAAAGYAETRQLPAPSALVIFGGDLGGADLLPADMDVLSGAFTNVGTFQVAAGTTVFIDPGVAFSVEAQSIVIEGTLDGSGAGSPGGPPAPNPSDPGNPGSGPGGGEGGGFGNCVHSGGGGGGGYGGMGGNSASLFGASPPPALGGPTYGMPAPPGVMAGSGGGAGGNHCNTTVGGAGGAGGGAITLVGCLVDISGAVLADGEDGTPSGVDGGAGGGGGSGGGIEVCGESGSVSGTLSARGGNGADGLLFLGFGMGGGGGGGGRVKVASSITVGGVTDVSGGLAGASATVLAGSIDATDGGDGSVDLGGPSCAVCVPAPTLPAAGYLLLALLLASGALIALRRRLRTG